MSARPLLALGGLATALVVVLALEYHGAHSEDATLPPASRRPADIQPRPRAGHSDPGPPNSGPPNSGLPDSGPADLTQARVDAILARPLFQPNRRPPASGSAASGPASLPRLSGVLVSGGGRSVIFAAGADGKPVVLAEGGRIGAYVVQSIGAGEAVVLGPEGPRTLRPSFGPSIGGATSPDAPGSPLGGAAGRPSILDLLRGGAPGAGGVPGLTAPMPPAPVPAGPIPPGLIPPGPGQERRP
jgi:hypothetical protein